MAGRRAARSLGTVAALALTLALGGLLPTWAASTSTAWTSPADLPPPSAGPDEIRRRADEVLDRPEFRRPPPSPLVRMQNWVREQLARALATLLAGGGVVPVLALAVLVAALAATTFFGARLWRGVRPDPRAPPVSPTSRARLPSEWRAEAARHEAGGDWRGGLRCRYRALVGELAGRGLVDEIPGRTTGEYRHEVEVALPRSAPAFARATQLFELAWYGHRPTGADESLRFEHLAGQVLAEARR